MGTRPYSSEFTLQVVPGGSPVRRNGYEGRDGLRHPSRCAFELEEEAQAERRQGLRLGRRAKREERQDRQPRPHGRSEGDRDRFAEEFFGER